MDDSVFVSRSHVFLVPPAPYTFALEIIMEPPSEDLVRVAVADETGTFRTTEAEIELGCLTPKATFSSIPLRNFTFFVSIE